MRRITSRRGNFAMSEHFQIDQSHFEHQGYCVVPNVLTPAEVAHYASIFE